MIEYFLLSVKYAVLLSCALFCMILASIAVFLCIGFMIGAAGLFLCGAILSIPYIICQRYRPELVPCFTEEDDEKGR